MVAFELRIPHTLRLAGPEAQARVWEAIKDRVPVTQPEPSLQVTLGTPGIVQSHGRLRMLDRGRTLGVVVSAESLVIESTAYRCYEEFSEFLRYVLAAIPAEEVAGFVRIGLRYINEVRIPDIVLPADWDGLVKPELIAETQIATADLTAQTVRGEVEYAGPDGLRVVMRHGVATGRIVNADGPLRTRTRETGPFLFIDLDSYWENPAESEIPIFSAEAIVEKTTQLREPVHNLFEAAITDRLREIFRRKPA